MTRASATGSTKRRAKAKVRETKKTPSDASEQKPEMPPRMHFLITTLSLACAAVVASLIFPHVQSSVWTESLAQHLQLSNTKSVLHAASKSSTGKAQVEVLGVYRHDPKAFTQGLLVAEQGDEKFFIESTGLYGESTLRKVDIETGQVIIKYDLGSDLFGEGVTLGKNGDLVMLTWKSKQGLTFDLSASSGEGSKFKLKKTFSFETVTGEGWGIDYNGESLIVSDGSSKIMFWDPVTMKEQRQITVTFNGEEVPQLNELEFANGYIYANIWYQPVIVKIDPKDGKIVAVFDCSDLMQKSGAASDPNAVLNGIAYDGDEDVFYVTGKLWSKLFKVRLLE